MGLLLSFFFSTFKICNDPQLSSESLPLFPLTIESQALPIEDLSEKLMKYQTIILKNKIEL